MIIFGLGNPLAKYKETRHNVGFMVVDKLAKQFSRRFSHHADYHIAETYENKSSIKLIKPMLYMNNSGIVVAEYLRMISKKDFFIVVYDDMALPLGKIRIREKGSDGGHQGIASIIYHLQSANFARLRIGIGAPSAEMSATDYVLTKFSNGEKTILDKVIDKACCALLETIKAGLKSAMNKYNACSVESAPNTANKLL